MIEQSNPSTDNGYELNQRFIVARRAVGNNRRWTGKDGFQAARQADERTGWMAGRYGLVILGQGIKHKTYLVIQTFTSAETGIYHCS